jgi:hypothetical protein
MIAPWQGLPPVMPKLHAGNNRLGVAALDA